MKVLKAKVNWYKRYNNLPVLQLLVDKIPPIEEMRYEEKEGIYYAELDGYVHFLHYTYPSDGFGGRVFHITMKDGSKKDLKGPWSCNALSVNELFGPCVDVSLTDDSKAFDRGWTFLAGSCSLNLFKQGIELAGVKYVKYASSGYRNMSLEQNHAMGFPDNKEISGTWIPVPSLSDTKLVKEK